MTNISFGRAIEIARIDEIAMRVNPDSDQGETQGAGERIIRLTRADIDIGDLFGAGSFTLPTSTTAKMAVLLFLGLADNLREPMAGPSRAFIAGVSSDPVMILSMVEDGVYATGVGIACFNVDHNILAGQVRFYLIWHLPPTRCSTFFGTPTRHDRENSRLSSGATRLPLLDGLEFVSGLSRRRGRRLRKVSVCVWSTPTSTMRATTTISLLATRLMAMSLFLRGKSVGWKGL